MKIDIRDLIDEELNKVEAKDSKESIQDKINIQNEKVEKEKLMNTINELKKMGISLELREDMTLEEIKNILDKVKV